MAKWSCGVINVILFYLSKGKRWYTSFLLFHIFSVLVCSFIVRSIVALFCKSSLVSNVKYPAQFISCAAQWLSLRQDFVEAVSIGDSNCTLCTERLRVALNTVAQRDGYVVHWQQTQLLPGDDRCTVQLQTLRDQWKAVFVHLVVTYYKRLFNLSASNFAGELAQFECKHLVVSNFCIGAWSLNSISRRKGK